MKEWRIETAEEIEDRQIRQAYWCAAIVGICAVLGVVYL